MGTADTTTEYPLYDVDYIALQRACKVKITLKAWLECAALFAVIIGYCGIMCIMQDRDLQARKGENATHLHNRFTASHKVC